MIWIIFIILYLYAGLCIYLVENMTVRECNYDFGPFNIWVFILGILIWPIIPVIWFVKRT
mgnify:CR=1 FL=1